jgi:hypothetical protein
VFNSKTGSSGGSVVDTICVGNYFNWKLSAISRNDDVVFWNTQAECAVLEFIDVEMQELILTDTPVGIRSRGFVLASCMLS